MASKASRRNPKLPSVPSGPPPPLESAAGNAGALDALDNELMLQLLTESGIVATIRASRTCKRLHTLALIAHGQTELIVRDCDNTIACAVYVAQLKQVKTLRVEEAGQGRFDVLALGKLRTPPGLRGLTAMPPMPPPPAPGSHPNNHAAFAALAAPSPLPIAAATTTKSPAPAAPASQLHRVRLAWTDAEGTPRVLGPLAAFYLGAGLATSVHTVPNCSLARPDTERPCTCVWATGKRGSPCVCESRMAHTQGLHTANFFLNGNSVLCGAQVRLTCSDQPCHMARVRCAPDAVREVAALAGPFTAVPGQRTPERCDAAVFLPALALNQEAQSGLHLSMTAAHAMSALRRRLGQLQRGSLRRFATPCDACDSHSCCGAWCGGCEAQAGPSEEPEEAEDGYELHATTDPEDCVVLLGAVL